MVHEKFFYFFSKFNVVFWGGPGFGYIVEAKNLTAT